MFVSFAYIFNAHLRCGRSAPGSIVTYLIARLEMMNSLSGCTIIADLSRFASSSLIWMVTYDRSDV